MINTIKKFKLNENIFAGIMVLALIVGLVPLYRLALYGAPYWDDYSYGLIVQRYYEAQGAKGVLPGIFEFIKTTWYAWQGTYGSAFFMSLSPVVFGEEYYFIGLWANITCISIAVFVFAFFFVKLVTKANTAKAVFVAALLDLFLIELIYTANQGFYWYNGATHYTFMYGLMLFAFTSGIGLIYTQKRGATIALAIILYILTVAIAGANYVVTLQSGLIIALLVVWSYLKKSKNRILTVPAMLIYAVGAYINIGAPGNNVREAHYVGCTPLEAIYKSFGAGFAYFPEFTNFITIVVVLIFAPVLWNIVIKMEYKFRLPALISILSFCMYATGFTPSLYGMGFPGVERTLGNVKWTMQILLIINEAYWLGWFACRLKKKGKELTEISYNILYYAGCLVLVFIVFVTSNDQAGSFSSYGAFYYIHTGEAYNYRAEYLARIELVNESKGQDLVVEPHVFRPWLLCGKEELDTNPKAEQNVEFAKFYGLNSVRLAEPEYLK